MTMEQSFGPPRPVFFEDYKSGTVYELGSVDVSADDIIAFARQYDPQLFHVDEEQATSTVFGGLIASGWHTIALYMRLFVEALLGGSRALGSPGGDELRWMHPVRPGDTLRARCTIEGVRASRSDSQRGVVETCGEMINQHGDVVMRLRTAVLISRR
jgi:acyl dehydratase